MTDSTQPVTPVYSPVEKLVDQIAAGPEGKTDAGFASRKFLVVTIGTGILEALATVGWLVLERMTAAEWVSLNQWVWPLALGLYLAGNVLEKKVTK